MNEVNLMKIEKMIYVIRGQKVMLDSDLAELYGVTTGNLNKAVKRNFERFPSDFMFQLNPEEAETLIFQIGISNEGRGGRRHMPYAFTESGVAMLSSVLSSDRAVLINVSIMRTFIKLRSFLSMENTLNEKIDKLEQGTTQMFKIVFERLDNLEENLPEHSPDRRKIGLSIK